MVKPLHKFLALIGLSLVIITTGCSSAPDGSMGGDYYDSENITLDGLKNLNNSTVVSTSNSSSNGDQSGSIRQVALHEMALSVGMRGGLYARSRELNEFFVNSGDDLDKIFDFRSLMLPNNVIPPVLTEAVKTMDAKADEPLPTDDDSFLLNDNPTGKALAQTKVRVDRAQNNFRTLRITDRVYKILRQARFAVAIPHWHDYLQLSYTPPALPESAILPKTQAEQDTWAQGIEEGWNLGMRQAEQILEQNLMLLRRDYLGMVRYRKLLAMNMVSAPYVADRDYGITGDGDEIKIHDRVLTIAALPALKPDSKLWTPYLTQNQEAELDSKINNLSLNKLLKYSPAIKDKSNKQISKRQLYGK